MDLAAVLYSQDGASFFMQMLESSVASLIHLLHEGREILHNKVFGPRKHAIFDGDINFFQRIDIFAHIVRFSS